MSPTRMARIEIEEIFGLGLRCVMRWRYDWGGAAQNKGHVRGVAIFHSEERSHLREVILRQRVARTRIADYHLAITHIKRRPKLWEWNQNLFG